MKKSALRTVVLAGAFALGGASGALAGAGSHGHDHGTRVAQSDDTRTIVATKLSDTLTLLTGKGGFTGGNVVVSNGEDGMLIIDDKLDAMTARLQKALADIGGPDSLRFVLNTHWHFDHTGGNAELGKTATIVAHSRTRERMSSAQSLKAFNLQLPPAPKSALPEITFDDSLSIHLNGQELQMTHFPASHTDTDAVVYFTGDNVLHTGDLFFNGLFPFIDIENGGDVVRMTQSVEALLSAYPDDVTIVPGHGPVGTKEDLQTFHTMLVETTDNVRDMMAAGKNLAEIKAAGVPAKWEGWAAIIDIPTWNSIIYASLNR
jgi:glyoxylase-like metal-dependent hydrolase (beta-lactamase superfamily II)